MNDSTYLYNIRKNNQNCPILIKIKPDNIKYLLILRDCQSD